MLCGMTYASFSHASCLRDLGFDVYVLHTQSNRGLHYPQRRQVDGITEIPLKLSGSGLVWNPIQGDPSVLQRIVDDIGPQVIIAEGWYTWGIHLLPALSRPGRRMLLISHGSVEPHKSWRPTDLARSLGYWWYDLMNRRRILRSLSGAGLLSFYQDKKRFRDHRYFKRYRVATFLVPNMSAFQLKSSTPRLNRGNSIAIVGEMSGNKNQVAALTACLAAESTRRVKFIYPIENEYSKQVKRGAASARSIAIEYVIGKPREQLQVEMDDVDLILLTSGTEAQPLVLIDGLALGIPFVSTQVGCVPAMRGGQVAELAAMPALIDRYFQDNDFYASQSRAAIEYFKSQYSRQHVLEGLAQLVQA